MGLFSWFLGSSRDSSEGEQAERPSFLQHLTGAGSATLDVWRKRRREVRKGYEREVRQLHHLVPKREKDFEESIEDQQKSFMRRAGLPQFVGKLPTKEEMQENQYFRRVGQRFEKVEQRMRKNFYESQQDARKDLKKQYHHQLKEISKELREGKLAPQATPEPKRTISVTQHALSLGPQHSSRA